MQKINLNKKTIFVTRNTPDVRNPNYKITRLIEIQKAIQKSRIYEMANK